MYKYLKFPNIFYGWWIVAAAFTIALYMNGVIVYGFTAIFEPLANEFSWTRTQISFAASLRGLEEGFLVMVAGMFVDRWGPRRFIFGGALLVALGFFVLSKVNSLTMLYGAYALVGLGRSAISGTALVTAIINWFRARAGIASGFALAGFMAGGLLTPVIVKIVDSYGWRDAATIITAGILILVLPLSLIFRHKPEKYGYSLDGMEKHTIAAQPISANSITSGVNITLKQAISGRAFWQITLAFTCLFTVILAFSTHILPFLGSIGMERSTTGFIVMIVSVSGIIGRIIFGFAVDKFDERKFASVPFIFMTVAMLCIGLSSTTGTSLVIIGLILYGASWGCNVVLRVALVRELFGRKRFASILGLMTGVGIIIAMAGPPLAGWVFDNWQNYQGAWLTGAGLSFLSVISILTIPKKKTTSLSIANSEL